MPEPEQRRSAAREVGEGATAASGLCIFALFAHSDLPLGALSICGLVVAALAMGYSLSREQEPLSVLGLSRPSRLALTLAFACCVFGLALGILYRWYCEWPMLPQTLRWFAPVAALIGGIEEVVYRGYLQGRLRMLGVSAAVVLAALGHTAYKSALFVFATTSANTDFVFLAAWTFLGGALFGIFRQVSKSVIPPMAAHMCFDIVVYGDLASAPWWVWS